MYTNTATLSEEIPTALRIPDNGYIGIRQVARNLTELRRIAGRKSNAKTTKPSIIHIDYTMLSSRRVKDRITLDVVGSETDIPVYVRVTSGMLNVNIVSGKAVVFSESVWGNVVTATNDARVDVVSGAGAKVSVSAKDNSTVLVKVSENDHRGYKSVSENASLAVLNTKTGERVAA